MAKVAPVATPVVAAEPPMPAYAVGRVLVDSGPLIALFNGADHWHSAVLQWLRINPRIKLISTWPVATEVCARLARRIANGAALDFLAWVQCGALALDRPEDPSLAEMLAIGQRFADLPFDLADASIAEAAARLKIKHLLSIDADCDVYRDRSGKPLLNLLRR
jgi:uncharacterized protein